MTTPLFGNPVVGAIHLPGWVRPAGDIEFIVTSPFGPRDLNGDGDKLDANENHDGIDVANARCGDPVRAAAAGIVVNSGRDVDDAIFGILSHGPDWKTYYWHLTTELLTNGTAVAAGKQIGTIGRTGNASACHLHFTIKQLVNGVWINRDPWLLLAQNIGGDMTPIQPSAYTALVNKKTSTISPANFRAERVMPPDPRAAVLKQFPAGTAFLPVVQADDGSPAGGATPIRWYGGFLYVDVAPTGRKFGWFHSSVVGPLEDNIVTGGFTQDQLDSARAAGATEGADAVLEAAKVGGLKYGAS